ncbi:unnamed protein product [Echinostoma caproni]|uniref:UPF0265 protein n=1 Tax=Echinostoma caproni TaxID=27848 RepID=A0A183ANU7_9TREM|nr:unnamed protein product [Echinostoma caproni]
MMTYGVDPLAKKPVKGLNDSARYEYRRRQLEGVRKISDEEQQKDVTSAERFTELIREVKERREFLRTMSEYGQDQAYRNAIETEISQLVREMEEMDRRETMKLNQALKANDEREADEE